LTFGALAQIPDPGSGQKVNYFKRVVKENIDFRSSAQIQDLAKKSIILKEI